jgi:phosphate:Na+ symporter
MSGTELFATFLGSVALLLWGVRMVRTGMMRAFGAALRRIISTRTRTRMSAFLAASASPASCKARPRPRCCSPPSRDAA